MKVADVIAKYLRDGPFLDGRDRPMRLRFAVFGNDLNGLLLPQYVESRETLCGGSHADIWCVSGSAHIELKALIGLPAAVDFVTDRGTLRSVCGIVTDAAIGDSDGGLCAYRLSLRDALSVMEMKVRTRVFRGMSELDIVMAIIGEWRRTNDVLACAFELELAEDFGLADYPQREFTMQYNESDAAFIRRLLRRRGISWFFRAGDDQDKQGMRGSGPVHTMVLFNRAFQLKQNAAGQVRFHRGGAAEESDTITQWAGVRTLRPSTVERFSWDYKFPIGRHAMTTTSPARTRLGKAGDILAASLEDYQIASPHLGDDAEDYRRLGDILVQRTEFESKCFVAHGTVRAFRVGEYFALAGHHEIDQHPREEREFVITTMALWVQNNLPGDVTARLDQLFEGSNWTANTDYPGTQTDQHGFAQRSHCRITAVRRGIAIVPAYDPRSDVPSPPVQTAIVVGPEGEEVYCDKLGRVLVCFPGAHSRSKRQSHHTLTDETLAYSAWVRVATNWAGDTPGGARQSGTLTLPHVGTEVLITFLHGDPDKPVITGQLYNGYAGPPELGAQGGLPANRRLSGIKSREFGGGRSNQLRLDDSAGRINAQLASDHGSSQLNLGFLVHPLVDGWGEARGQGAELRSDQAVAVRGAQGALITAQASEQARGGQLDCKELSDLLDELGKLSAQLAKLAQACSKDAPSGEALADLVERAKKFSDGGQAMVAVSGPGGIAAASGSNIALGAQTDIDLLSGGDTAVAAAGHLLLRAARDISLFANEMGLRFVAAKGPVTLQAQDDAVEIVAKKVLDLISSTDWINIKARKGVRIYGGGSELIVSDAGIKGYTGGKHEMYAADHQTFPKQSPKAEFPGEIAHHDICLPCLLKAAKAHSASRKH